MKVGLRVILKTADFFQNDSRTLPARTYIGFVRVPLSLNFPIRASPHGNPFAIPKTECRAIQSDSSVKALGGR